MTTWFEEIADRIFGSWQTTVLAVVLAAAAAAALYFGLVGWTEWSEAMATAIVFLFARDPKRKIHR